MKNSPYYHCPTYSISNLEGTIQIHFPEYPKLYPDDTVSNIELDMRNHTCIDSSYETKNLSIQ